jgi:5-methylcytosine-specific restriction endonuclease McrA
MNLQFSKASQLQIDTAIRDSKKQARRKEMDAALKVWSRQVRDADKNTCAWCGGKTSLQAHHIVARALASHAGQLDLRNGMCLCYRDHIHRLKQDPDGYVKMRDNYLAKKGLSYEELRLVCGHHGGAKLNAEEISLMRLAMEKKAIAPAVQRKIVVERQTKYIASHFDGKFADALREIDRLKKEVAELRAMLDNVSQSNLKKGA